MKYENVELTITSDGTPRGTVVTNSQTGVLISNVQELKWHIKADESICTAEILLINPSLKLTGTFKVSESPDSDV